MEISLVLGSAAAVTSLLVLWWALSGARTQRATISLSGGSTPTNDMHVAVLQRGVGERTVQPLLARFGRKIRRYTPQGRLDALEQLVFRAGARRRWTVERVLAVKVLLAVMGALFGVLRFVSGPSAVGLVFGILLVVIGFLLPDLLLRRRADERQQEIRRSLADTIDQLSITVQAGLGINAAIARVAATVTGPLGGELSRAVQDMRAGLPRAEALLGVADRTGVPELRQFVMALTQSEKLGVPIAKTLSVQAGEMRVKRRQHAEEQAMKLPVKILFPMVVCIMPCIFIVILGPAAITIYNRLVTG
ncbi:MAG: type II secretion system F family protein [Acidimicrobiia bacterium]